MKRFVLMLFLLLAALMPVSSQIVIKGKVINEKSKEPVQFAVPALMKDTAIVSSTKTEQDGSFLLKLPASGVYKMRVSYISFDTYQKTISIGEGVDTIDMGNIYLTSKDYNLGTAVVTATVAKMEQVDDTTVYNAAAYRVPEGSTLEALVKQLNGVQVEEDGTIKVNGKTVKEVLINGKDFFKGDTQTAMKNLPSDLVNKIKTYDKKSDYAEQTGIDDGEEETVLDVTTKRALNESWITNVDLGLGTKSRYSSRIFVSRFDERSYVSIIGSANNVNDMGFSSPRGGGGGGGLTASKQLALAFNIDNGKKKFQAGRFEIGGNLRYNYRSTDNESRTSSQTFLSTGASRSFGNSNSKSMGSRTNLSANLNLRWSPDTLTNITFRPQFTYSESNNRGNSWSATFNDDPYNINNMEDPLDSIFQTSVMPELQAIAVNANRNLSKSDSRSTNVSGRMNITRRLSTGGRNVNLSLEGGVGSGKSHSYSISNINYFQSNARTQFMNRYSDTPSKNWNYSAQIGYVEPIIAKKLFAEFRYQYGLRYTDSERSQYNLNELDSVEYGVWRNIETAMDLLGTHPSAEALADVIDLENSRYATYKYYNHRINFSLRWNSEKLRVNAGVSLNPQRTKLDYTRPAKIDTVVTRNVFNISPDLRFRYRFSKTNNLDISYRGSASQPSMTDLLDVWDDSNPLNVSGGNPNLKPSWTNTFNMNYRGYNADRQQGIAFGLNFSQTSNSISSRVVYNETTGVRYSRPDNINGNWNGRANFMFNTALGYDKLFNVSTFTELTYNNRVGYISETQSANRNVSALMGIYYIPRLLSGTASASGIDYGKLFDEATDLSRKNTTKTLNVSETLRGDYRSPVYEYGILTNFDAGLVGTLVYENSRASLVEDSKMNTWRFSYGASGNVNFSWGMSISTDIRMSSRRGYSVSSMNTNELLWNMQISQSFLKGNAATLSIQFYDLLHEQSNVSRAMSALSRSDTWTNAINSYVMVHFIYKLNIFAGGSSRSKNAERRGFGDDGPKDSSRPVIMRGMGGPGGGGGFGGGPR